MLPGIRYTVSYAHSPQNCPQSFSALRSKGIDRVKPGKNRAAEWAGMKNGTKRVVDINPENSRQYTKKSHQ
jgi:hypothetical protein